MYVRLLSMCGINTVVIYNNTNWECVNDRFGLDIQSFEISYLEHMVSVQHNVVAGNRMGYVVT
jgi:hypothetical protein